MLVLLWVGMTSQPNDSASASSAPLPATTSIVGFVAGPLQTNCYVLIDSARTTEQGKYPAVVIDPGMGAFATIQEQADEQNFAVEAVVLTHGHIDHIRDAQPFAVPVYIHPEDKSMLSMDWSNAPFGSMFEAENMQTPADIRELEGSIDMAGATWEIHHMPGHSPGSVMFRVPGLILGGDVIFRGGVGRADLPGSSPEDMMLSLKKFVTEFADDDVVLSGHGPQTTIGQEKATNPFLHEVG